MIECEACHEVWEMSNDDVSSGLLGIEAQSIFFSSSTAFGESDRFFDDRRGDSGAARASRRRPLSTASMPAGAASSTDIFESCCRRRFSLGSEYRTIAGARSRYGIRYRHRFLGM